MLLVDGTGMSIKKKKSTLSGGRGEKRGPGPGKCQGLRRKKGRTRAAPGAACERASGDQRPGV